MKIGFDASRAFIAEATGTENYSKNLLLSLAMIDHKNQYRVYLRNRDQAKVEGLKLPANFEFVNIRPGRLWTQFGLALETWKNPIDVLFVPAHTLPVFKNPKVRGIVTIHDLGVEYLPQYHQFPQRYYIDLASKFAASTARVIIAVSAATKDDLVHRYRIEPNKVFVVHEGVDTGFFRRIAGAKTEKVRAKYKIGKNYVLFVGTVQPRKNLEMLIRSFAKLVDSSEFIVHRKTKTTGYEPSTTNHQPRTNNLQLVIAGKLGWDYQEILDLPKRLGIGNRVKFLGYVDRDDLPALYSGAAVFAFPSLFEGFGLPILEALSCGCRVIASDIAVHREIENILEIDKAMVLVKVKSVDEWTRFLYQSVTLGNNKADFEKISVDLASKFSWLATAKQTLKVFETVLG